MAEPEENIEIDIDQELAGLFAQAEQGLVKEPGGVEPPKPAVKPAEAGVPEQPSISQMLRPIVQGIEALTRASGENTVLLGKLSSASPTAELVAVVGELRAMLEQKNGVSQRMFDALHEELRGYKDGFLLDALHRPVIRDLIALYDEFNELHRQMLAIVAETTLNEGAGLSALQRFEVNLRHNVEFVLEVLFRMEVTQLPLGQGKLDKRNQRALSLEPAATPEEDGDIVRVLKRGFVWQERVVRPEEVVCKRWKESPAKAEGDA